MSQTICYLCPFHHAPTVFQVPIPSSTGLLLRPPNVFLYLPTSLSLPTSLFVFFHCRSLVACRGLVPQTGRRLRGKPPRVSWCGHPLLLLILFVNLWNVWDDENICVRLWFFWKCIPVVHVNVFMWFQWLCFYLLEKYELVILEESEKEKERKENENEKKKKEGKGTARRIARVRSRHSMLKCFLLESFIAGIVV